MPSDIGDALRRLVAGRAFYRCEYCLLSEDDSFSPHQVDHVVSRKHGGLTVESNLAYACLRCNAWKGSDIVSVEPSAGRLTPLYHPRQQHWVDHFRLHGAIIEIIEPLTPEGIVTARLLRLNLGQRVAERHLLILIATGRYPGGKRHAWTSTDLLRGLSRNRVELALRQVESSAGSASTSR